MSGADKEQEFDFEKLTVYQLSLEFLDAIFSISRRLPAEVRYSLHDQLIRAALSISNNLAEGAGKRSKKEKSRYFGIALDSARECISMFNVMKRQQFITQQQYLKSRQEARRITGMLHGLIKSL